MPNNGYARVTLKVTLKQASNSSDEFVDQMNVPSFTDKSNLESLTTIPMHSREGLSTIRMALQGFEFCSQRQIDVGKTTVNLCVQSYGKAYFCSYLISSGIRPDLFPICSVFRNWYLMNNSALPTLCSA